MGILQPGQMRLQDGEITVWDGTSWKSIREYTTGRVGGAVVSADQTGITAATLITNLFVAFTAKAGRRYAMFYTFPVSQVTTSGSQLFNWTLGGVAQGIIDRENPITAGVLRTVSGHQELGVLGAGSKTISIDAQTSAGTLTIPSGSLMNSRLSVFDIGT